MGHGLQTAARQYYAQVFKLGAPPMENIRVQLELPEDKVREIDSLMADAGISTRKLYIEYALATLKWALNQSRDMSI